MEARRLEQDRGGFAVRKEAVELAFSMNLVRRYNELRWLG